MNKFLTKIANEVKLENPNYASAAGWGLFHGTAAGIGGMALGSMTGHPAATVAGAAIGGIGGAALGYRSAMKSQLHSQEAKKVIDEFNNYYSGKHGKNL